MKQILIFLFLLLTLQLAKSFYLNEVISPKITWPELAYPIIQFAK